MQDITTLTNGCWIGADLVCYGLKTYPGFQFIEATGTWCGTPGYQFGGAFVSFVGD